MDNTPEVLRVAEYIHPPNGIAAIRDYLHWYLGMKVEVLKVCIKFQSKDRLFVN